MSFNLVLSHWFVFTETSRQYIKNLGGPIKTFDFQSR